MPRVTAIIPVRLESTRFPRKALYPINGKPLIFHVWRSAHEAKSVNQLYVATDSIEIAREVTKFGGAVIMTSSKPRNGSERTAEAIADLKTDIVVSLQADNFGLAGKIIDRVVQQMTKDKSIAYATLARKIEGKNWADDLYNPNVVKVIGDKNNDALWFSRYPIPFLKKQAGRKPIELFSFLEHIGIYFFKKESLMEYVKWPRGQAEKAESLEQLRILENGEKIRLFLTRSQVISIDSKETLQRIKA